MAALNFQPNMGPTDRMLRGGLGALMLMTGLRHRNRSILNKTGSLVGSAFMLYGITGFDPLLAAFGASTRAGDENHIMNLMKNAMPGQGYHPTERQQPVPLTEMPAPDPNRTVAESLSIQ